MRVEVFSKVFVWIFSILGGAALIAAIFFGATHQLLIAVICAIMVRVLTITDK